MGLTTKRVTNWNAATNYKLLPHFTKEFVGQCQAFHRFQIMYKQGYPNELTGLIKAMMDRCPSFGDSFNFFRISKRIKARCWAFKFAGIVSTNLDLRLEFAGLILSLMH